MRLAVTLAVMVPALAVIERATGQSLFVATAQAQGAIRDIRVVGNRRVEPETVRSYLQFSVGDVYDAGKVEKARVIMRLRAMEFSIEDIAVVLAGCDDEADILNYLEQQKNRLQQRIQEDRDILRSLNEILSNEKAAKHLLEESSFAVEEKTVEPVLAAGIRMKAKIVKNKVAPPFRETEFDMLGSSGISYSGDLLDMAAEDGFIEKSGSWFNYGKTRIGQGRDKARQFLEENPDIMVELRKQVLIKRGYAHVLGDIEAKAESA